MKLVFGRSFEKDLRALPPELRDQTRRQLQRLLGNPRHPSLRLKKMKGHPDLWELRVTGGWRVTMRIEGDTAELRRVGPHDVLRNP